MTDLSFDKLPQISSTEMEDLSKKFEKVSVNYFYPDVDERNIKRNFIAAKLNSQLSKDKLEKKISLTYSDKLYNASLKEIAGDDAVNFITKESKLATYKKILSDEINERVDLEAQQKQVVEIYADQHFKPPKVTQHYFETPEARNLRSRKLYTENHQKFVETNWDKALAEQLRYEIRRNPDSMPEGVNRLHYEEHKQNVINKPEYKQRITNYFHDTPTLNSKNPNKLSNIKFSEMTKLNKILEQTGPGANLDPRALFTEEVMNKTPEARTVMFSVYKSALTSAKNKVADEIDIEAGRKKSFRSLV